MGFNSAGMGLYAGATVASVVETHPSEIDGSYSAPAAKKLRVTGSMAPMVSGGPQLWGAPQHVFLHGMGPTPFVHVPPPRVPTTKPMVFAAAVSADDDDSKSAQDRRTPSPKPETDSPKPRGPRIKLLKRRLEQEQGN